MNEVRLALLCLLPAAGVVAAPPKAPPNPMSGKSVVQLGKVLESGASEMDRVHAALAFKDMVSPPGAAGGKRGKKGGKTPEWELEIPEGFIDACMTGLADRSCAVRFYSAQALELAGADALPALTKAVGSDNDDCRVSAMHAIGMMAKKTGASKKRAGEVDLAPIFGSAVPALRKALKDKNYIVRETACATLARLGTAGAAALGDLIALLEDEHFCVVNQAVHAVAAADPGCTKSVPALVKALESEHEVREFIVKELGNMGQTAKGAVPALCGLVGLGKNSWHVALESTRALLKIVTYDAEPAQDAVIAERNQALSAIGTALMNQDAKFLQARIRNAVLDNRGYCPIGEGAEPLVEWFEQTLREYVKTERGHYGPPLPKVSRLLAEIGRHYKTEHLLALAKELKAAEDTKEAWLEDFEPMLKLEGR